ncbi:acylphosphatase [Halobacillus karajensis]|uniref:Acylphosphatase n=1 Tax=Halobacillus karajensis TaxID=195088 RepID=A0A024P1L5_9BACI|nr:acylphosphatase [Halobacillus karajensis]CDQ19578.1 Acylphosphatase [Halobacillus karajensis]CDQ22040.1 Acylphosphatase [Halobacillus karajensis]CDQ27881.1 Acylphosphatase [Halobacillus karajensis]SEH80005.1 acylphosphatase [Halobacillus karajensis]
MENNQITVHGRVQGVGFRAATKQIAEEIGVAGWVKNQPDGTVLIEVEGKHEQVKQFIKKIQEGPTPYSKVNALDITNNKSMNDHEKFKVLP